MVSLTIAGGSKEAAVQHPRGDPGVEHVFDY
jgi:hypothetical protein